MTSQLFRFALVPLLLMMHACDNLMYDSKNEVVIQMPNPAKAMKAVLFVKQGGATVGNSYQISILEIADRIQNEDVGNVFIADDHDGPISNDTSRVKINWLGNDSLKISFDKGLRLFKTESKVEGLSILYDSSNINR